jgi:hypothetical protein
MAAPHKIHGFEVIEGGKGRMVGQSDHGTAHDQAASAGFLGEGRPMKIFGGFPPATGWLSGSAVGGDRSASEPGSPEDFYSARLKASLEQMEQKLASSLKAAVDVANAHTTAPKSEVPPQVEKAHNPPMTEVTRELLDAKLDSVRAEVRASIAESSKETVAAMGQLNTQMATMQGQMLTEMQGLRADFANMLKDVTKEMAATGVAVANVGGKVEGLEGKVDGLKSSINMLQFVVGTVVVGGAAIIIGLMQVDLAKNPPQQGAGTPPAVTQPAK